MADKLPYRPCVGVMVLNREGRVWMGHRIAGANSEVAAVEQRWQMPQGGIDPGEDAYQAALRELYEETGMRSVSLLAEAPEWIDYDLPPHLVGKALRGMFCGQRQKWFALRFTGEESEIAINPPPDGHEAEFDDWAWRDMDELTGLIVPFKRPVYEEVVRVFRHLV